MNTPINRLQSTRHKIEWAIKELVEFIKSCDRKAVSDKTLTNPVRDSMINEKARFLVDDLLADNPITQNKVGVIVFDTKLLVEHKLYKKIPRTNRFFRYDTGNSNTATDDHIHVYDGKNSQLYAINRPGTSHDGSKAVLGKKEIMFLRGMGFTVPDDGILEWIILDENKDYLAIKLLD